MQAGYHRWWMETGRPWFSGPEFARLWLMILFDVVGTLFSLQKVERLFRRYGVAGEMAQLWYARTIQSAMAGTLMGKYIPFREAAEASLRSLCASAGWSTAIVKLAVESLQQLDPWEDASECLETLRENGHRLFILTNSSSAATESLMDRSGFLALFERAFSVDEVAACKPHPSTYWHVLRTLHLPPADAFLVAVHGWDVAGAAAVGMNTVWVSHLEKRWPLAGTNPGFEASTLAEVPTRIPSGVLR